MADRLTSHEVNNLLFFYENKEFRNIFCDESCLIRVCCSDLCDEVEEAYIKWQEESGFIDTEG